MVKENFLNTLDSFHLLKHPFYQLWNEGKLEKSTLQNYAKQYFHNVDAFPRYVSSVHSMCTKKEDRKILLENLIDEERGQDDHPSLWLKFCNSLGIKDEEVYQAKKSSATNKLIKGFIKLTRRSYSSGLGALFAYERQVPEVAESKISGLKKFYGYEDSDIGLKFFSVHIDADQWHSKECKTLIDSLNPQDKKIAEQSSVKVAKLLWNFLDGMLDVSPNRNMEC